MARITEHRYCSEDYVRECTAKFGMRLCVAKVRNDSVETGANSDPAEFHPVLPIKLLVTVVPLVLFVSLSA